jgi:hypothetical protein
MPDTTPIRVLDIKWIENSIKKIYGVKGGDIREELKSEIKDNFVFDVNRSKLLQYQLEYLNSIKHSRSVRYILGYILTDLCNRKMLAPGKYILAESKDTGIPDADY